MSAVAIHSIANYIFPTHIEVHIFVEKTGTRSTRSHPAETLREGLRDLVIFQLTGQMTSVYTAPRPGGRFDLQRRLPGSRDLKNSALFQRLIGRQVHLQASPTALQDLSYLWLICWQCIDYGVGIQAGLRIGLPPRSSGHHHMGLLEQKLAKFPFSFRGKTADT